ncbi:hypothetical protein [Caloramator proteoclasticus]|uniref:Uncharacterized protein n=1 Tax=Caloramator proteoclasticus DSM 10124 TaxID=1121262 RepID=A0A1M4ZMP8_9CLOT|nr:hypothetical protein [Caloramator proteoclasticus]SHF19205.1 hypothetical protein SAMN02746091_01962 [Caloramator proteoclasticus DSM 10124]
MREKTKFIGDAPTVLPQKKKQNTIDLNQINNVKYKVERMLNSIGKSIFIKYYYDFKDCYMGKITNESFANKLLNENKNAKSIDGQIIRINNAKKIFSENLQILALEIIKNSKRLDEQIITEANKIILEERII